MTSSFELTREVVKLRRCELREEGPARAEERLEHARSDAIDMAALLVGVEARSERDALDVEGFEMAGIGSTFGKAT